MRWTFLAAGTRGRDVADAAHGGGPGARGGLGGGVPDAHPVPHSHATPDADPIRHPNRDLARAIINAGSILRDPDACLAAALPGAGACPHSGDDCPMSSAHVPGGGHRGRRFASRTGDRCVGRAPDHALDRAGGVERGGGADRAAVRLGHDTGLGCSTDVLNRGIEWTEVTE